MKLLKKYYDSTNEYQGTYIFMFNFWRFKFDWFTDCGDWFIYLYWYCDNNVKYVRFSSAGFMSGKYKSYIKL